MNKKDGIISLYQKFLSNSATREELLALFEYLKDGEEQELKQLITVALAQSDISVDNNDNIALLQNVRMKILDAAESELAEPVALKSAKNRWWYYAAASIALAISVAAIFMISKKQQPQHASNLLPGSNIGMLTVGGTDTLNLQTAKPGQLIKRTAGVAITKSNNGTITYTALGTDTLALSQINTLITPRGGQYRVRLTDGTEVLLNAESKLEFPVGFTGNQRHVTLTGEAYFEVAKIKQKPFIVTTAGQNIQVLGTKFNVSNFAEDGGPVTTLTEGSVKVSNSATTVLLKPGQQSRAKENGITVNDVDADLYSAWKNGEFVFENVPLDVIMHKLSRWYNFETDYSRLPQKSLYMKISRQVTLSEVLAMITTTSGIKFSIDERRVTVM